MGAPESANLLLFSEIIEELNRLVENETVDEFSRARLLTELEQKAQRLRAMDQAYGFSALGSIACMRGELEKMHRYHKMSLELCRDMLMFHNYASSLLHCGELQDAYAYGKVAYDLQQDHQGNIAFLVHLALQMRDEQLFLRYAAAWERLVGYPHPEYVSYLESLKDGRSMTVNCMRGSESSLGKIWNTPEEDEAWAHLQ